MKGSIVCAGLTTGQPLIKNRSNVVREFVNSATYYLYGEGATDHNVAELRKHLVGRLDSYEDKEVIRPGRYSLEVNSRGVRIERQIVFTAFSSLSALLNHLGLGSEGVAFDGDELWFSVLGAVAYIYGVNVIDPQRRTADYELRLWEGFDAGFSLGLPHFAGFCNGPGSYELLHLTLEVISVEGLVAYGSSEPHARMCVTCKGINCMCDPVLTTLCAILQGTPNFMFVGTQARGYEVDEILNVLSRMPRKLLLPPPKAEQFLRKEAKIGGLGQEVSKWYNTAIMRTAFSMSEHEIEDLWYLVCTKMQRAHREYSIEWQLQKYIDRTLAEYTRRCENRISGWVVVHTDPISPQLYYGSHYLKTGNSPIYYHPCLLFDECALCKLKVSRGELNSVLTVCGHLFHLAPVGETFSRPATCGGLMSWTRNNRTCPYCRQELSQAKKSRVIEI